MKKPNCGMCAICFLLIGNLAFSIFSYIDSRQEITDVTIEMPVSKDLLRVEAKVDDLYKESKLRDSAIYRTILDIRESVIGRNTISQSDKIAEL